MTESQTPSTLSQRDSRRSLFLVLCIFAVAIWLRIPSISTGLPFFYLEDEAHHFNRIAEMVKEGRYDPLYFHKPSLHFYLRMPVVAASFLWGVKQGHLRSVQEIETRDPYGVGKYAFTASHPGIVKWNRGFSVLLALGSILLVYLITSRLAHTRVSAILATALLTISPDFIRLGAVIGVDIVMTFTALLTAWYGLLWVQSTKKTTRHFTVLCLLAGLTVSSKYNALPIMAVPLALAWLERNDRGRLLWRSLVFPWIGFFVGSPYILLHLPLFLDQLSYEVWHYAIAGHVGNMAEPGLPQIRHYGGWLLSDGIGVGATILGGVGLLAAIRSTRQNAIAVFLFPLLFTILMCAQKANFTRNMLVILPFAAIAVGLGIDWLRSQRWMPKIAIPLAIIAVIVQPLLGALEVRNAQASVTESRRSILDGITKGTDVVDTAISGQLQFPNWAYRQPGMVRFSEERESPLDLYLEGYDQIIVRADAYRSARGTILQSVREIAGEVGPQRIITNPAISILNFRPGAEFDAALLNYLTSPSVDEITCSLDLTKADNQQPCRRGNLPSNPDEAYEWITKRASRLRFSEVPTDTTATAIVLSIRTPWSDQEIEVLTPSAQHLFSTAPEHVGEWQEIAVPIRSVEELTPGFVVRVHSIHSPKARGIGEDSRRLGVAVRSARLIVSRDAR